MVLRNITFHKTLYGVFKFITTRSPIRTQSLSIMLPIVYCSKENLKKIDIPSPEKLTHKYLLKQASNVTANSAMQLLHHALNAMLDAAEGYEKSLNDIMSLIDEGQQNLGNEFVQQEVSDSIVECRAKVNLFKQQFLEFESLLEFVEKVVVSTSETAFLVGADHSSVMLSEQLYSAKQEVSQLKKTIEKLEQEYLKTQQHFINISSDFENNKKQKN